ncbi:CGG triplet repeat-binding protein 1 [Caligus rogercresseyi]|uniref:CGG triplet repeat-binding protein 1 n=1 Tax=Caligus rogercresseyi TaxID=217165 RepID=A0A7T8H1L6_CALRO|nr:CGG triplet repeat-binding protein 1 [Caligus rogercresseyi]
MVAVVECRFEPSSSPGQARLWDRRNLPGSVKGLLASKCFDKHLLRDQFIH